MKNETSHSMHTNTMKSMDKGHYQKLIIMALFSFISMYLLMYSMINSISNLYPNINQFYMAGLMTMPMIIIEVILMRHMYMNKKLNAGIIVASVTGLIVFFVCIRQQAAVSDRQFVRGMIPHHAAAILMSKKSNAKDPEILKLQQEIITNQEREIAQMKQILERMKNQ